MDSRRPWMTSSNSPPIDVDTQYVEGHVVWVPKIGMEFDSVKDAWNFWINYGRRVGFNCRWQYSHKSKTDNQYTSCRFVCSKEGVRKVDKRDHLVKKPRAETRNNCPARMGIQRNKVTGKYVIHDFIEEHSHEFCPPETTHMMPSQREISEVDAREIDLADDSGIRPRECHEFKCRRAGGVTNLGYTNSDLKNYLRTKRQHELQYGEAGSIIQYFQQQSKDNPSFCHRLQFDVEEQITNIFWADPRMLIDYAHFGDVVTFDTTYCTNKEHRPLAVFVGFNHHRKVVVFGAALLYDETKASFKWLFEAFLEVHGEKRPKTIFTDQDIAMGKAIEEVMPEVRHGLCTFHLMQNAIRNLGSLLKKEGSILRDLSACMYEYEEETQFQNAWDAMVRKYDAQNDSWLANLYKLKEKWAACHMKNTFTIGMRSTQLSESFNKDLKCYLKYNLDVNRFFRQFERVLKAKRYKELEKEYSSWEKLPRVRLNCSPFILQVHTLYTPDIFEQFQDQVDSASLIFIKKRDENDLVKKYVVGNLRNTEEYNVTFIPSDEEVFCTCRKFETYGILCRHALRILDICDVKRIPEQYILKRWTRKAKSGLVIDNLGNEVQEDLHIDVTERYKQVCPKLVRLAARCSENYKAWCYIVNNVEKWLKEVDDMCDEEPRSNNDQPARLEYEGHIVKGLKKKTGRKGGKRLKSWMETKLGKGDQNLDKGKRDLSSSKSRRAKKVDSIQSSQVSNHFASQLVTTSSLPMSMVIEPSNEIIRRDFFASDCDNNPLHFTVDKGSFSELLRGVYEDHCQESVDWDEGYNGQP